ncbi:MAG: NAD-dependent deacylase [Chloroflexi bacterium]|nr:NAD-dependent deacylase [Chloroflexota bacterium]
MERQIAAAAALLKKSGYMVALTGAGISTPSGIPDFRSPQSGVWDQLDPMEVASISAFRLRPQAFFDWVRPLTHTILAAQPNPAHLALVQLERYGPLKAIITQNIDMLHTRAGSQTVYEVHGDLRTATCLDCPFTCDAHDLLAQIVQQQTVPVCPACGGTMKPNVILFGEALPWAIFEQARHAAATCDLMLVAGSSLEVAPASDLPYLAKRNRASLIIVNWGQTPLDSLADIVIRGNVADVLPRLAESFLPG